MRALVEAAVGDAAFAAGGVATCWHAVRKSNAAMSVWRIVSSPGAS
jgi:hypothetical protein